MANNLPFILLKAWTDKAAEKIISRLKSELDSIVVSAKVHSIIVGRYPSIVLRAKPKGPVQLTSSENLALKEVRDGRVDVQVKLPSAMVKTNVLAAVRQLDTWARYLARG